MQLLGRIVPLALCLSLAVPPSTAEIYDGGCLSSNAPVKLRIGNGGAGQSGLVKELANRFIQNQTKGCTQNLFRIEWVKGDTTETIRNLELGNVDLGITYNTAAEMLAINDNIAYGCNHCPQCEWCKKSDDPMIHQFCGGKDCSDCCQNCGNRPCYMFRDHFYLVGPKDNTPRLAPNDDIVQMFSKIYSAAQKNDSVRFLSRYDKSATNIKDAELWIQIGQVPWAIAYSKWYHQYLAYPLQALEAAVLLHEFTITDRGTHLTLQNQKGDLSKHIAVYKSGENDGQLLNPAHVLFAKQSGQQSKAREFWLWAASREGQDAIVNFHKGDGKCLYKGYPYPNFSITPKQCTFAPGANGERLEL